MLSVKQFITAYTGWAKDVDGAAGIQCVDLAKEHFRIAGDPNWQSAIGGDGYADNIWYNRQRWMPWYEFIDKKDGFKDGDMVIFPHKDRGGWTHPSSHVCFYYQGKEFGTNQGQKPACLKPTDWSDALGALRWKEWAGEFLPYGYTKLIRSGITALVYRGNYAAGYTLHVLSSENETDLKDIEEFDSEKIQKVAVVNAGYFQMAEGQADPYGTHYGVEQDPAVGNVYTQAPKQAGILAFYEDRQGNCEYCTADQYFGKPEEVNFAITPYAVRIHEGKKVFGRSVNYGDKDDIPNTQTAAVKFNNGDWAVAVFPDKICPRDTVTFFDHFTGVQELILMDSGGSSQMRAWNISAQKMENKLYTERKIPNVLVIAKLNYTSDTPATADLEPAETPIIVPAPEEKEEDEPMAEETSTPIEVEPVENWTDPEPQTSIIAERIAALLSVKSILTLTLTVIFGYLVVNQIAIPDLFNEIYKIVILFFFGYQTGKAAKHDK